MGRKVAEAVTQHSVAHACIERIAKEAVARSRFLKAFILDLESFTSTELLHWVDTLLVGYSEDLSHEMYAADFKNHSVGKSERVFFHPQEKLPHIIMKDDPTIQMELMLRVESIPNFCMMRGIKAVIEGDYYSALRKAVVSKENGIIISCIERRSMFQITPVDMSQEEIVNIHRAREFWQARPRLAYSFEDEEECCNDILSRAEDLVRLLGKAKAASCILEIERDYWLRSNRAAQIQYFRQKNVGVGFANISHHTFFSSRKYFNVAVRFFEILGFVLSTTLFTKNRTSMGTATLVMEQPKTLDRVHIEVDAHEAELVVEDFAHKSLEDGLLLGESGLWCALHGESLFQAGMHHVAISCSLERAQRFFSEKDVMVFPSSVGSTHMHKAFTAGDVWKVQPQRMKNFFAKGCFSDEEMHVYLLQGYMGSQMGLVT